MASFNENKLEKYLLQIRNSSSAGQPKNFLSRFFGPFASLLIRSRPEGFIDNGDNCFLIGEFKKLSTLIFIFFPHDSA